MKVYLFGSTGMLGNYVRILFQKDYNIECITRDIYDIGQDSWNKLDKLLHKLEHGDVLVNCAGIIPQKINCKDYKKYISVNSLFPHMLQHIAEKYSAILIHITTDCVFDGKKGSAYNDTDFNTENNIYGVSKSLGEPENATVIRTSIIGEDVCSKRSLLEWVKSNKNGKINGYTNYFWNGCTCLSVVKYILTIIETKQYWKGIKYLHSRETISKHQLLHLINEIYHLNIEITPILLKTPINKSLSGMDNIITTSLREQLIEQKKCYLKT